MSKENIKRLPRDSQLCSGLAEWTLWGRGPGAAGVSTRGTAKQLSVWLASYHPTRLPVPAALGPECKSSRHWAC